MNNEQLYNELRLRIKEGEAKANEVLKAIRERGAPAKWNSLSESTPDEGRLIWTKIDDKDDCRNGQILKRQGNLFFTADGSMYVYYTPTHWAYCYPNTPTQPA